MPEFAEEPGKSAAEAPFPQGEAQQRPEIVSGPQIPPAQGEGGPEPAADEFQPGQKLAQQGKWAFQGPHRIGGGTQQHPCQEAAEEPLTRKERIHFHSPRFLDGSS